MQVTGHMKTLSGKIICMVIAVLVLNACGGKFFTYKGAAVTRKNLKVSLLDGDRSGEWNANDQLTIKYKYQKASDALKISGKAELLAGMSAFKIVKQLSVYLLFLDANGLVIDDPLIFSTGNFLDTSMTAMTFDKALTIPQGTRALSFAYTGELVSTGTGGQTTYSIWNYPR